MPGRTIADLYSLRHLSLQGGIPDSPAWIRAQAWKVLLGYLPAEKKEWASTLSNRRQEYYVSPAHPSVVHTVSDRLCPFRPHSNSFPTSRPPWMPLPREMVSPTRTRSSIRSTRISIGLGRMHSPFIRPRFALAARVLWHQSPPMPSPLSARTACMPTRANTVDVARSPDSSRGTTFSSGLHASMPALPSSWAARVSTSRTSRARHARSFTRHPQSRRPQRHQPLLPTLICPLARPSTSLHHLPEANLSTHPKHHSLQRRSKNKI